MQIIPKYLLFNFLKNFVLWMLCIIGLFVIFDLFTNFDSIFGVADSMFGTLRLVVTYYFYKSLPFFDSISGLLSTAAAMITVSMLMRNNELVPLLAAGISELRIVRPVFIAAIAAILLSTFTREAILPNCQDKITASPFELYANSGRAMNSALDLNTKITLNGEETYFNEQRIQKPHFSLPKEMQKQCGLFLSAESAIFMPTEKDRPAGYFLKGVTKPANIANISSQHVGEQLALITAQDADWVGPNECFVVSSIPFEYLASNKSWQDYSSTWQRIVLTQSRCIDFGSDSLSTIHQRIVQPLLDVTLLFLGLPIILQRGDKNVFKGIGIASLVIVAFFVVKIVSQYVGVSSGMPILGVWVPLLIFVPIAVNLYTELAR